LYVSFDTQDRLLNGVEIWRIQRKEYKFATCKNGKQCVLDEPVILTSFVFNQLTDIFSMVNTAIIEHQNASRSRIWFCERKLHNSQYSCRKRRIPMEVPQVHEGKQENEQQ
jgi:hypothetical protein